MLPELSRRFRKDLYKITTTDASGRFQLVLIVPFSHGRDDQGLHRRIVHVVDRLELFFAGDDGQPAPGGFRQADGLSGQRRVQEAFLQDIVDLLDDRPRRFGSFAELRQVFPAEGKDIFQLDPFGQGRCEGDGGGQSARRR